MKRGTKLVTSAVALSVLGLVSACVAPGPTPGNNNASTVTSNANNTNASNANTNTATAAKPAEAQPASPVTLAVLDAFLNEPTFTDELGSKLSLTDEELAKVKAIAGEARVTLSEGQDVSDESRSTAESEAIAVQRIDEAIGKEKSSALFKFAAEKWEGGAIDSKAGTVPSDTRIVVNAPAYRLDVFENGTLTKTYKVGIGYPEFPLPVGLRKAQEIILNPTWTPPDEPWVKGKVKAGEKIEASDPRNPLGPIKIPIGSPSLIHGGKSPAKLGGFASHGCVGMTTPQIQEFAALVARIGGTTLTSADIASQTKKGSVTKSVKLDNPIPVELRYETITVEDGKLHVYRDVYERKTNTEANLQQVLQLYGVSLEDLSPEERTKALDALKSMSRSVTTAKSDAEKKAPTGKVTTAVKGAKEVVIEVAALAGKGYPAPAGESGKSAKGGAAKTGKK